MKARLPFDPASLAIILVTLLLFVLALFEKGFTHDLLLEAGVLMVSVKLIIMAYKNSLTAATIDAKLDLITAALKGREAKTKGGEAAGVSAPEAAPRGDRSGL
jgi:hypothetical protein